MKVIINNKVHLGEKSHEVKVMTHYGKVLKMTYESYNAVERFMGEVWDGNRWNHMFSMLDLGIVPDNDMFFKSKEKILSTL